MLDVLIAVGSLHGGKFQAISRSGTTSVCGTKAQEILNAGSLPADMMRS